MIEGGGVFENLQCKFIANINPREGIVGPNSPNFHTVQRLQNVYL